MYNLKTISRLCQISMLMLYFENVMLVKCILMVSIKANNYIIKSCMYLIYTIILMQ